MAARYRGPLAIKLIGTTHSEIYPGGEIVVNNELNIDVPSIGQT
jgi:hypothetical protein